MNKTEQPQISLADIRLPRKLEADNTAHAIRQALLVHTVKLRPESDFVIPLIEMTNPLKIALRQAKLRGYIRCGFEDIAARLESERMGIASVRQRSAAPDGKRISRLLLFSNDGAGRLYRHIEQILRAHEPRLLGCLIDMDSNAFGDLITGKDSKIKIAMVEHKAFVCDILKAIIENPYKSSGSRL